MSRNNLRKKDFWALGAYISSQPCLLGFLVSAFCCTTMTSLYSSHVKLWHKTRTFFYNTTTTTTITIAIVTAFLAPGLDCIQHCLSLTFYALNASFIIMIMGIKSLKTYVMWEGVGDWFSLRLFVPQSNILFLLAIFPISVLL